MFKKLWILVLPLAITTVLAGDFDFNKSIRLGDGETRDGDLSSVNGKISVGDDATVGGDCSTVNGSISVGSNSRVESLETVNGSIKVDRRTVVEDEVETVNGSVTLGDGTTAESVATVNGKIRLDGAEIERGVKTVNGDIELTGATVGGDIVIQENRGNGSGRQRSRRIELDEGSIVQGDVINEDPDVEVRVYLRAGSRIEGRTENVELIKE